MSQMQDSLCQGQPRMDWSAKWVWVPASCDYPFRNSYAFFRRRFSAGGRLRIDIAADTRYEFHIDGRRVERGTAPAVVSYKTFDTHHMDVQQGDHVIGVLVHHIGETCPTAMQSRPGLLVEISAESGEKIATDGSWKTMPVRAFRQDIPQLMSHFGFYEICDCSQMPEDWSGKEFDDSSWAEAEVMGEAGCQPWIRLIPRDIPLLATDTLAAIATSCGTYQAEPGQPADERERTVAEDMVLRRRCVAIEGGLSLPIRLGSGENEFLVMDFGREVTGHVRLVLEDTAEGQQIDIGYDELLDERHLPNPRRTYVQFADRFFLRADQRKVEVFDGRGFRYLLLDVPMGQGGITLTGVELNERTYPVPRTSSFRCSDDVLNELYEVGLTTTRLCMLDTYVDCPSRERVMWMDMCIEGLCSAYGMGITQLWRRVLYIFAQNTLESGELKGAVRGFAPTDSDVPKIRTYMMYYVCALADYVMLSGDRQTGDALFDTAMKQLEILGRYATADGLIGERWPSDWAFLDWSAMDYGGVSSGRSAIYMAALRKAAVLARQLDREGAAEELQRMYIGLVQPFWREFWSEHEGLFVDAVYDGKVSEVRSQLSNVLPIWAGLVSGDPARSILWRITDAERLLQRTPGDYRLKPGFEPQTGGIVPMGTPAAGAFLPWAMFELGMDAEAVDYLKTNWVSLARNGTFAEHFVFDDNTSMCHGWSAAPALLLPRYVLGLRPLSPGWETVEFAPHVSGLDWAEGSVITPLGDICVRWDNTRGRVHSSVTAPAEVSVVRRDLE